MIPLVLEDELLAYAAECHPEEACGLVSTDGDRLRFHRARNARASGEEFLIAPREQFDLLRKIDAAGERLIAVFHSHPRGTVAMSAKDIAYARRWPGIVQLIAADGCVVAYTHAGEPTDLRPSLVA